MHHADPAIECDEDASTEVVTMDMRDMWKKVADRRRPSALAAHGRGRRRFMLDFWLHQGDATEWLKTLPGDCADLIDTDCAYESLEKHRKVGTTTRLKQSDGSSNEWFEIFRNERFPEFFSEAYRVLKKDRHFYFFCDSETARIATPIAERAGFKFWNDIIWVKTKTEAAADDLTEDDIKIGLGYHYRRSKEIILFFEKGKRRVADLSIADVLPFPPVHRRYPTEKPVPLHKVLIEQSTQPGEIVVDPFMGSASAGAAAIELGRSFWGNDLSDKSLAVARDRLSRYEQARCLTAPPFASGPAQTRLSL